MAVIYHIAAVADWAQARQDGQYAMSTRGRTLAQEGFIHTSTAAQVAVVANAFYQDAPDLVLLVIDPGRVTPTPGTGGAAAVDDGVKVPAAGAE